MAVNSVADMATTMVRLAQQALPGIESVVPEGFAYAPELITPDDEQELLAHFRRLPFKEFDFHGYKGRRRVIYFGVRYDFNENAIQPAEPIPPFLLPLRGLAAAFARLQPKELCNALVTEYAPGAGIGWHRDRPDFADVIGVSFASRCRFRFRRKAGSAWQRTAVILGPRSAYILRGPARSAWEHSIPPGEDLRFSVTFRSIKQHPSR